MSALGLAALRFGGPLVVSPYSSAPDRERIDQYRAVLRRDPCSWCGALPGAQLGTVEHVVPLACGGGNDARNVVGACRECNQRRGVRSILEFLRDAPLVIRHVALPIRTVRGVLAWRLGEQEARP